MKFIYASTIEPKKQKTATTQLLCLLAEVLRPASSTHQQDS